LPFFWQGLGWDGISKERSIFVLQINNSLFNIDGLYTLSILIKTEGLVTPLAIMLS